MTSHPGFPSGGSNVAVQEESTEKEEFPDDADVTVTVTGLVLLYDVHIFPSVHSSFIISDGGKPA